MMLCRVLGLHNETSRVVEGILERSLDENNVVEGEEGPTNWQVYYCTK